MSLSLFKHFMGPICVTLASTAFALPCRDKPLAFADASIKVSAYEDCKDPNIAYIVPQELTVEASRFAGAKSFEFKEATDGSARVVMKLGLLVEAARQSRVMEDLRRTYVRPFRFAAFEIRGLELSGFNQEDGVIAQKLVAKTQDSFSYFLMTLDLNSEGRALWVEAAEDDFYSFSAASLSYQMHFSDAAGGDSWVEQSHAIFIDGLPSCEILHNCDAAGRNARLLSGGKSFGAYYFRTQFLQCSDLLTKTFFEPSLSEIEDSFLDEAEREIVWLAAEDGFRKERVRTESACAPENEKSQGKDWWEGFVSDKFISCANVSQWPFPRVQESLAAKTANFVSGVRLAYDAFTKNCNVLPLGTSCDERKGESCGGILTSNTSMCVSAADVKKLAPADTGNCILAVYESFVGSFISRGISPKVDVLLAKTAGLCLTFTGDSLNRSDYRTQIVCK